MILVYHSSDSSRFTLEIMRLQGLIGIQNVSIFKINSLYHIVYSALYNLVKLTSFKKINCYVSQSLFRQSKNVKKQQRTTVQNKCWTMHLTTEQNQIKSMSTFLHFFFFIEPSSYEFY